MTTPRTPAARYGAGAPGLGLGSGSSSRSSQPGAGSYSGSSQPGASGHERKSAAASGGRGRGAGAAALPAEELEVGREPDPKRARLSYSGGRDSKSAGAAGGARGSAASAMDLAADLDDDLLDPLGLGGLAGDRGGGRELGPVDKLRAAWIKERGQCMVMASSLCCSRCVNVDVWRGRVSGHSHVRRGFRHGHARADCEAGLCSLLHRLVALAWVLTPALSYFAQKIVIEDLRKSQTNELNCNLFQVRAFGPLA